MNIHRLAYWIVFICSIGFTNGTLATEVVPNMEKGTAETNALIEGKWAGAMTEPGVEYRLGFVRNPVTGKMLFTLNNQPYLPVMYMMPFQQITQGFLNSVKRRNCNGLVMQMDAADMGSEELKKALDLCRNNKVPIIAEINEWEYWHYLETHLDLNMVMFNGKHVRYFPDYANSKAKEEHLARFKKAAQYLKSYAHTPIIAISVGAYDAFHLPDGEVHNDWTVPENPQADGTYVPYGPWVQKAFANYLDESDENIFLPDVEQSAVSAERWKQWIYFRRALVRSWVKDTLEVVRKESGLPCTLSFDLDFSQHERYATPPFEWTDLMDFVIVYYYGTPSTDYPSENPSYYVPLLLRTAYKEFNDAGKPMIALLEFSSAGNKTSGADYARYSAPFVSGFITTDPSKSFSEDDAQKGLRMGHTVERVNNYLNWIGAHKDPLLQTAPPPAKILTLVDKQAIFFENSFTEQLTARKIPYDIAYVSPVQNELNFSNYQYILLPPDFPKELANRIKSSATFLRENNYLSVLTH